MMRGATVLAGLALSSACAHDRHGNAWAHHELTVSHDVEPAARASTADPSPRFSELVLAGSRVHALLGTRRVGYHIGADLAFGSTLRATGFAYDLAVFPVGAGLRIGAASAIMLGAGIGATGAVGTIDDAVTWPIELVGELDAGGARILSRARMSATLSFADEAEAMLALRVGHRYTSGGYPTGNGYFAGVAYRELHGARFVGLIIGYSLDVATRRERGE